MKAAPLANPVAPEPERETFLRGPSLIERIAEFARWHWSEGLGSSRSFRIAGLIGLLVPGLAVSLSATIEKHDVPVEIKSAPQLADARRSGRPPRAQAMSPSIDELAERLMVALPQEASLHALAVDEERGISVQVDLTDPDLLRPALAQDPLLRSLREVDQSQVQDLGFRVSLSSAESFADTPGPSMPDLVGIVGRLPERAVALVRVPDEGVRSLEIGDSILEWRLTNLAADAALFARGGDRLWLYLPPPL